MVKTEASLVFTCMIIRSSCRESEGYRGNPGAFHCRSAIWLANVCKGTPVDPDLFSGTVALKMARELSWNGYISL